MKIRSTYLVAMVLFLAIGSGCTDSDHAQACENDDDCARDWSCSALEGQNEGACVRDTNAECDAAGSAACGSADSGADIDEDAYPVADAERGSEGPRLHPDPQVIHFSRTDPFQDGEHWGQHQFLTVQNTGSAPLRISNISIPDNGKFAWSVPDPEQPGRENDTEQWPSTLEPGQSFILRVIFRPDDSLPETGELVLESNDPASPSIVELDANTGTPCIDVKPSDELPFGESSISGTTRKSLFLENCHRSQQLEIEKVYITDGGDVFSLVGDNIPGTLEPGETTYFEVAFAPTEERAYNGELSILSNDPTHEDVRIALNGSGDNNVCPTAVATASVQGERSAGNSLQISPESTVQFDATASSDPDGTIARYEWSILSQPPESTSRLTPGSQYDRPKLFVDVAGTYELELRVFDNSGMMNCGGPARVTINAVSE